MQKGYVYVQADSVYRNEWLDDRKLRLPVAIGGTVDGKKEIEPVHKGCGIMRSPSSRFFGI